MTTILADLNAERKMFVSPSQVRETLDLASYGRVLRLTVNVVPSNRAAFEARAAGRIAALLAERGFAIPPGREVMVQLDVAAAERHHVAEEP